MSDLLNSASLVMIPSGYKEDTVYSVVPSDGSGDLSFTRASNGTRVNSAGLVEVCPWNLLESSETFNLSPWNPNAGATITNTSQTAPNGTATADILNTPNISSGIYQVVTGIVGQVYTASLYVKNDSGATGVKYQEENSSAGILFNAVTGAITGTFGTVISSSVENVGNGWYRIQYTYTSTNATNIFIIYSTLATTITFVLWGAQLNIGSTAKPYFPTTDRLNVPRLTYQNGGGGCPSLLLEKQSTNILSYSEDFANGSYFEYGSAASVTGNTAISPDGTQNADTLTANGSGSLFVRKNAYQGTGATCAVSVYAKKANNRYIGLRNSGTTSQHDVFDFDTKTWTNNSGAVLSYDELPNGWFRLKSVNTDAVNLNYYWSVIPAVTTSGAENATASNLTIYLWGGQAEYGSYPTSYISTTSSSATRVADVCSKTGIGALVGGTSGTVFFDIKTNPVLSSASYKQFCYYFDSASAQSYMYLGGTNLITTNSNWGSLSGATALVANTRYKIALVYAPNDFALYVNGVSVATASSGTPKDNVNISIGQITGSENCEFVFNQYTHFPSRLTNAELASLTTI